MSIDVLFAMLDKWSFVFCSLICSFSLQLSATSSSSSQSSSIVQTEYGQVQGFVYQSGEMEKKTLIHLGIPFAKPPIGPLRFKKPEVPENWQGVLNTTKWAPACAPHHKDSMGTMETSEDCLYLNVISPLEQYNSNEQSDQPLYPVLFWIHGGGFAFGGAQIYGYEAIARNYPGLVIVTIQYRLGPFGFLSTGDDVLPGNLGYWDQTAALTFVHRNIHSFGGDPNRVTVFGLSAGGASVAALTLSPHSRDYFQQAIEMSGSYEANWANSDRVVDDSRQLITALNCHHGVDSIGADSIGADSTEADSIGTLECLRSRSVLEIQLAVEKTGSTRVDISPVKLCPRIDGHFLPVDYDQLLIDAPKKPTIIGFADTEAGFFTVLQRAMTINPYFIADPKKFDRLKFESFIAEAILPESLLGTSGLDKARKSLIDYYLGMNETSDHHDGYFYVKKYTELLSDVLFIIPPLREAEVKRRAEWPIWLYVTEHFNPSQYAGLDLPVKGAFHADLFSYMFEVHPLGSFEFNEKERRMQKTINDAIIHFAYHGTPGVEWQRLSQSKPLQYLSIQPDSEMRTSEVFARSMAFWRELSEKFPMDLISRKPVKRRRTKTDEL